MLSPDDPQNLNRYSYAFNSPQRYIDPTGYAGEDSGGYYYFSFYSWYSFFKSLFGSAHKPKPLPKRQILAHGPQQLGLEIPNGGLGTLKNVLVYDSQTSGGSGERLNDATLNLRIETRPRPPWMDEPGLDSPTIDDPLDILFGVGAIAKTAIKQAAKVGTTSLWRAVGPRELTDIQRTGIFRNLGSAEGKYFSTTAEGASSYAKQAVQGFGDAPYTLIKTEIPSSLLPRSIIMDRNVPGVILGDSVLPRLTPKVLDYFPLAR